MLRAFKSLLLLVIGCFSINVYAEPLNALFRHSGDPIAGNPRGSVTVVEFFDYQCGHCSAMAPVIAQIIRANPNVRFVFKEFPVRGPMSLVAARAALAANKQGKYYRFNHALLTTNSELTEDSIFRIAESIGLNVAKLKKDMNSSSVNSELQSTFRLADDLNINGTPAFFIGKTNETNSREVSFVMGEMSRSELQNAINRVK